MRTLVFDAGPVISLATTDILFILKELNKYYDGKFVISSPVKRELITKPLETKKYRFEALQVMLMVKENTLVVYKNPRTKELALKLSELANNSYKAKGEYINIVHLGEIASIAACILLKSDALVIDERTTRMLVEDPVKLRNVLSRHLDTDVVINRKNLDGFRKLTRGLKIIRSVELVTMAFEKGILDKFRPELPFGDEILLESVLWGVKLNGCSVPNKEIEEIVRMEAR